MKLDWSKALIATMALFIVFIVSMGIKMATSNQAIYEEDYYEKGEMHTERMEQEKEGEDVKIRYDRIHNTLAVSFDSIGYVSEFKLLFLADNTKDFGNQNLEKSLAKNQQLELNKELKSGIWYYEVMGEVNGRPFFKKQQFVK